MHAHKIVRIISTQRVYPSCHAFAPNLQSLTLHPLLGLHCETLNLEPGKDDDKMVTNELQQFLNGRVPHATSSPISTGIKLEERNVAGLNAQHCDTSAITFTDNLSTGMALLQQSLHHENPSRSCHHMSEGAQHILRQLLQSNGLDLTSPGNFKEMKELSQKPSSPKSRLFPLIVETVNKLQQNHDTGKSSFVSASEIIQGIAMDLTSIEPKGTLRAEDLPASVESNHAIYAALLFLSQPLHVSSSPDNITPTSKAEQTHLFPPMPLLNAERTDKEHHPKTFHLHPTNLTEQKLHDLEFLAQLECLEDVFWGSSSVLFQSRCHIVPRFDSQVQEEHFIRTGETKEGKSTSVKKSTDKGKKRKSNTDDSKGKKKRNIGEEPPL